MNFINLQTLQLICLAGRARCNAEHLGRLAANAAVFNDWHCLSAAAEKQSMAPLFYNHCRAAGVDIPVEVRRQLQVLTLRHQNAHQLFAKSLGDILPACKTEGLEVIILNEVALAWTVYPSPGLRPTRDIKLLTLPSERDRLEAILLDCGYRLPDEGTHSNVSPRHRQGWWKTQDGMQIKVAIQHTLLDRSRNFGEADINAVIERGKTFMLNTIPALSLCPEDLLRQTYQQMIHAKMKIIHFSDLVSVAELFANEIDWHRMQISHPAILAALALLHQITILEQHLIEVAQLPISTQQPRIDQDLFDALRAVDPSMAMHTTTFTEDTQAFSAKVSGPDPTRKNKDNTEVADQQFQAVWDSIPARKQQFLKLPNFENSLYNSTPFNHDWQPGGGIPKIIHQTWKDEAVPAHLESFQTSWEAFHPDWLIKFWTDSSLRTFIETYYRWFLPLYDNYPEPIMRVDAARYFLLYHYGGVYVDMDFEALRPLDPLLAGKNLVLGREPEAHAQQHFPVVKPFAVFVCNAIMASVPHHPFWQHVFQRLVQFSHMEGPMEGTGPFFLSRAYAGYAHKEQIHLEPPESLYPISVAESQKRILDDPIVREHIRAKAYTVHHWYCTWWEKSKKLRAERVEIVITEEGKQVERNTLWPLTEQISVIPERQNLPRVICLMENNTKPANTRAALCCFQKQTYPNRELWMGEKNVPEGILADNVRRMAINGIGDVIQALEQAGATYFALWQADGLHDPSRLATQIGVMEAFQTEACLLSRQQIWISGDNVLGRSPKGHWPLSLVAKLGGLRHCLFDGELNWGKIIEKLAGETRTAWVDSPHLLTRVTTDNQPEELQHGAVEFRGEAGTIMVQGLANHLRIDLSSLENSEPIPRVLHQTWKDANIPKDLAVYRETWKQLHPHWSFILWTDTANRELIKQHYAWFLPSYDGYPEAIMRADAARYFILHHFGGLYVDLDFEAFRALDPLLTGTQVLLGLEPPDHLLLPLAVERDLDKIVCNAFMAATPEHPFWKHVLQKLTEYSQSAAPLDATGPFLLTRAYESYVEKERITLAPAHLLYPISNTIVFQNLKQAEQKRIREDAYAIHHWYGSWWRKDTQPAQTNIFGELREHAQVIDRFCLQADNSLATLRRRADLPLVSAMMVTGSRPEMAKRSVRCFLNQTYREKELVILDDGEDLRLENFVQGLDDRRVRFYRMQAEGKTLGDLRNLALERSHGKFVAQWDDDDLSDPQRLEIQMAALLIHRVDACLLQRQMIWYPHMQRLAISNIREWEGSFICRKSKMPAYPSLRKGEDTPVIEQIAAGRYLWLDYPQLYIYIFHGKNTFDAIHFGGFWKAATQIFEGDAYRSRLAELSRRMAIDLSMEEDAGQLNEHMQGETSAFQSGVSAGIAAQPLATRKVARQEPAGEVMTPKVLILIPVKDAVKHLPLCLSNLRSLTFPHARISLGFVESDSQDETYTWLSEKLPDLQREFRRTVLLKRDYGYRITGSRWAADKQRRRREILARSRNYLLSCALQDEDWVLWLDADVAHYPENVIESLLAHGKEIAVPNCVVLGSNRQYDLNTYRLKSDADQIDWQPYIIDGLLQPPAALGRWYLNDLQLFDAVEVDAVGGTMLLIRADLHREGLIFPPYPYRLTIETEGLSAMAKDMGYHSWGLPKLVIHHSAE
jgi:mannosyltransferase OCH1-like enzyme/glycosyltransferase involved in cell wall biosynthesis